MCTCKFSATLRSRTDFLFGARERERREREGRERGIERRGGGRETEGEGERGEVKIQPKCTDVTPTNVPRYTRPDDPPVKNLPAAGIVLNTKNQEADVIGTCSRLSQGTGMKIF